MSGDAALQGYEKFLRGGAKQVTLTLDLVSAHAKYIHLPLSIACTNHMPK